MLRRVSCFLYHYCMYRKLDRIRVRHIRCHCQSYFFIEDESTDKKWINDTSSPMTYSSRRNVGRFGGFYLQVDHCRRPFALHSLLIRNLP